MNQIDRWFLDLYNYSVKYHEGDESAHTKILTIQDEIRSLILKAEFDPSDLIVTEGRGITIKEAWEEPNIVWDWQPMETAPKDGETILIWDEGYGCPMPAFYECTFEDLWLQFGCREVLKPFAWMPLPDPPRFDN